MDIKLFYMQPFPRCRVRIPCALMFLLCTSVFFSHSTNAQVAIPSNQSAFISDTNRCTVTGENLCDPSQSIDVEYHNGVSTELIATTGIAAPRALTYNSQSKESQSYLDDIDKTLNFVDPINPSLSFKSLMDDMKAQCAGQLSAQAVVDAYYQVYANPAVISDNADARRNAASLAVQKSLDNIDAARQALEQASGQVCDLNTGQCNVDVSKSNSLFYTGAKQNADDGVSTYEVRKASVGAAARYKIAADDMQSCMSDAVLGRLKIEDALATLTGSLAQSGANFIDGACRVAVNNVISFGQANNKFTELVSNYESLFRSCALEHKALEQLAQNADIGTKFSSFAGNNQNTGPHSQAPQAYEATPLPSVATASIGEGLSSNLGPLARASLPNNRALAHSEAAKYPFSRLLGRALASVYERAEGVAVESAALGRPIVPAYVKNGLVLENLESGEQLSSFSRLSRRMYGSNGLRFEVMATAEARRKEFKARAQKMREPTAKMARN